MNNFSNVIGYQPIKNELERILDILKNPTKYKELGVYTPKGLLLNGIPGVGKTLFATTLVKESGRNAYIIRKNKADGDFVNLITDTFNSAKLNAPSIVYLDDMDKFSNNDSFHPNSEEFVTIQSCIDDCKDSDVFVIATTNDLDMIPESLLRSGRMDKIIHVYPPVYEDSIEIIKHYLSTKKYSSEIDEVILAKLLRGYSCADLENVINEAGIYAAFEQRNEINMDDVIKSILRIIYNGPSVDKPLSEKEKTNYSVHESGHVLISEILNPGSVDFVSIKVHQSNSGGFTSTGNKEKNYLDFTDLENALMISLGGKAATEMYLGEIDIGANSDLHKAFDIAERIIDNHCAYGFNKFLKRDSGTNLTNDREATINFEVERYYQKVKSMMVKNKTFLEQLIEKLKEKEYLTAKDILDIRKNLNI